MAQLLSEIGAQATQVVITQMAMPAQLKGAEAATAALQGLAGGNLAPHDQGSHHRQQWPGQHRRQCDGASPYWAPRWPKRKVAAPLAASLLLAQFYPDKSVDQLTESEKQTVSALTTLTGTLAGALVAGNSAGAVTAGQTAKNEVENNFLSQQQIKNKQAELARAATPEQRKAIEERYAALDKQQRRELVTELMSNELGVMIPVRAEQIRDGLKQLLTDPTCTANCRRDVQTSIMELDVQLSNNQNQQSWKPNVQPTLNLAESVIGILAIVGPGASKGLKGIIGLAPGSRLGVEAEAKIANQFYKDGNKWADTNGALVWPKSNGFVDLPKLENLKPGIRLDRYGGDSGRFLSPAGTPFEQRAIPNASKNELYKVYEVVRPFEVQSGKIAP
ncbi:glycohydrolase toxin TNT-related protein [Vogesella indigofera]|uniref:glycohydrolase toxin TNT-related protein n=1 Tax=Vogesella indigofera TaxID=45465 RepID=UPI0014735F1F|nr:glycohydrolase toxin TNT-related protein [Vogesella indigofera]